MPNTYSDASGFLYLKKITPVILAFLGGYDIKLQDAARGIAEVLDVGNSADRSWESIHTRVVELLNSYQITVPENAPIEILLKLLGQHYGQVEETERLINEIDFSSLTEIDNLFDLARIFDDGHEATRLHWEIAYHCDHPIAGKFGGSAIFAGKGYRYSLGTAAVLSQTSHIDAAANSSDVQKAAEKIKQILDTLLIGFTDQQFAQEVRNTLFEGKRDGTK